MNNAQLNSEDSCLFIKNFENVACCRFRALSLCPGLLGEILFTDITNQSHSFSLTEVYI